MIHFMALCLKNLEIWHVIPADSQQWDLEKY